MTERAKRIHFCQISTLLFFRNHLPLNSILVNFEGTFKIGRTDFGLRGGLSAIFMADLRPIMHSILHCKIQARDKFLPVILGKARSFAPSCSVKTENQSQHRADCFFPDLLAAFFEAILAVTVSVWEG